MDDIYNNISQKQKEIVKFIATQPANSIYKHQLLDRLVGSKGLGLGAQRNGTSRNVELLVKAGVLEQKGMLLKLKEQFVFEEHKKSSKKDNGLVEVWAAFSVKDSRRRLIGIATTSEEAEKLVTPKFLFNERKPLVEKREAVLIGDNYYLIDKHHPHGLKLSSPDKAGHEGSISEVDHAGTEAEKAETSSWR